MRDDGAIPTSSRSRSAKARYCVQRRCAVALREVDADQHAVGALAKRLVPDRGQARLGRLSEAAQQQSGAWQRASSACVRSARSRSRSISTQSSYQSGRSSSRPPERRHVGAAQLGRRIEHASRPGDDAADVDSDDGGQLEAATGRLDEPEAQPSDAPERRAQASGCVRLVRVEPERAGDIAPQHRLIVQRQEGEEPLRGERQLEMPAFTHEREAVEQLE